MHITLQDDENMKEMLDCIRKIFSKRRIGTISKKSTTSKKKGYQLFLFFDKTLVTYLWGVLYIYRSVPVPSRKSLRRTFLSVLNGSKTIWLRFAFVIESGIINNEVKSICSYDSAKRRPLALSADP